jgi:hypothetical protein
MSRQIFFKNTGIVVSHSVQCLGHGLSTKKLGFDPRQRSSKLYKLALGSTQPPTQWVSRALSFGVKRPEREADHSPPSSEELKMPSFTPPLLITFRGLVLNKTRGYCNSLRRLYVKLHLSSYRSSCVLKYWCKR